MTFPVFFLAVLRWEPRTKALLQPGSSPRTAWSVVGPWFVMQSTLGAMEHGAYVQRWLMDKIPVGTRSKNQEKLWNI